MIYFYPNILIIIQVNEDLNLISGISPLTASVSAVSSARQEDAFNFSCFSH